MAFNFDNDPVFSGLSDTPAPAANPVTPITKNPEQPANQFSFENDPVFAGLGAAPATTPVTQPGIQKPAATDQTSIVRGEMRSYEPTILDRIMDFFPDNKARASNELFANRKAEEEGKSVDQVYKEVGFGAQRPMLNPEGRAPVRSVVEGTKIFVKRAPTYPVDTANAVLRTIRGGDTTVDDSTLDELVNWTTTEQDPDYDTNYDAVYNAGSSLGFSIATMATAAATYAGVQAATANPVAATVAGMAASGATAFRASKDQFLSNAKEMLDKQSMEVYGRPINQDEWDSALEEFNTEANKYGAWEAIPEAVSNIVFVKALSAPMKGMGKTAIATAKEKASRVVADYLKTQATETGTETITAMGQSRAEANVGLRDESLSLSEAVREVLPSTVLLTSVMNVGGASARYAAGKFGKKPGADKSADDAMDILGGVETADDVLGAEAMQPAGVQRALPAPVVAVDKAGVAGTLAQREKATAAEAAKREILGEGDPAAIARDQERTAQSGYAAREKIAQRLPENLPDPRLGRDQFRNKLETLATTDFIKGGGVSATIDPNYQRGESDGDLAQPMTGRTPSLNPEWAQALLQETGATTEEVGKAVSKAMAGERLGVRQARIVSGMLDYVSDKRNNPETLAYMKRERENAQHLRRVSRGEIPSQTEFDQLSDQYAGSRFDEREYPAHWDGESRSLYEIMNDAVAANPEETDRILTASAQNEWSIMTTVQMLQQRVLGGGQNAQQDASGSVEQGAVQPQEGLPAQAQDGGGIASPVATGQPAAGINPAISQPAGIPAAGSVESGQPAQVAPAFDLASDPVFAGLDQADEGRRHQVAPVATEQRQNPARRTEKRTDEMTLDEAREALRTSDKNALRNERAYNEDERLDHQAFFDVDDFKNLNDKLTYAGGDLVIDEIGRIMAEEATDTVIPYHLHGDEFIIQSNDEQALTDYSNRVQSKLKSLHVPVKLSNGSLIEHTGVGVSYGIGSTKEQAESRLKADKKRRQQSGQRSGVRNGESATEARGEPVSAPGKITEGKQDRAGRTDESEKVAPAKKKNPAKSEDGAAVSEPKKNPAQKVEADPIQFALDNNTSKDKYLSYLTGRLGKAEFAKQKADIESRWNDAHPEKSVVATPEAPKVAEAAKSGAQDVAVERYQWMRNKEGGQSVGNRQEISRLSERLYNQYAKTNTNDDSFSEYQEKYPEVTHINLVSKDGGNTWIPGIPFLGDLEKLRPSQKVKKWVKRVDSFDSEDAKKQEKTADSDIAGNAEAEVTAILDAANVTGKDRLDIMAKFRSGEYSLDDIKAAYPAKQVEEPTEIPQKAELTAEDAPVSGVVTGVQANEKIDDLGDKIGGARKDTAKATGPKNKKTDADNVPAWRKRYVVIQNILHGKDGKWNLFDKRTGIPLRGSNYKPMEFDTEAEAEKMLPMVAIAVKHRVRSAGDGKFSIFKNVGDKKSVRITPEEFDTYDAGMQYMAEHAAELLEVKQNFGEEVLPTPENVYRYGKLRRTSSFLDAVIDAADADAKRLANEIIARTSLAQSNGLVNVPSKTVDIPLLSGGMRTSLNESAAYMTATNIKFLGYLHDADALSVKGYSGLDIPSKRLVQSAVLSLGHDSQILGSVIQLIPVDMMNLIAREKISAKGLLSDKTMLGDLLSVNENPSVASPNAAALALIDAIAGMGAEGRLSSAIRSALETDTAISAYSSDFLHDFSVNKNVTGQQFISTFGFRSIEFGNWNNQEERQEVMNHAYDALLDMAEIINVPPKAISLNGDLALAFGARGQGLTGAKAHYEPDYAVINLTKMSGAGSLAHEWLHSLDHYLSRLDGAASSERIDDGAGNKIFKLPKAKHPMASHGFLYKSNARPEVTEAFSDLIKIMFKKAATYVEDTKKADDYVGKAREELRRKLDALGKELAEQKDPTWYKRNNKPAKPEQIIRYTELADSLLNGEIQERTLRSNENKRSRFGSFRDSNDIMDEMSAIYKAVRGREGFKADKNGVMDRISPYVGAYYDRIKMLKDADAGTEKTRAVPTDFYMQARAADQARTDSYWSSEHEMAARAFAAYVEDKLKAKDAGNDFLAYKAHGAVMVPVYPDGFFRPYPEGKEREAVNAAFDKFFGIIKTKETDTGVAMYSKGQPSANTHTVTTLKSAIDKVIKSFGYGVDKLLDTGKVKIVTSAEAEKVVGNKMFSRAFHGSPFRFDKFTLDHIGKGEGAQAYGYGLYFAGNKEVAEYYRKGLSYREIVKEFRSELPDDADLDEALDAADTMTPARGRVIRALAADEWLGFDYPAQAITAAFKELENYDPSPELREAVNAALGQLYEVNIPEDETMLLWDKPLSEQSENVKVALRKKEAQEVLSYAGIGFKSLKEDGNNLYNKLSYYFDSNRQLNENGMPSTDDPQKLTSNFLNSIGITGIKYLDGTSRDKGEGSFNYVIFDDKLVDIENVKYSKSGTPLAFFNPADGITYFIADNINKNSTDAQIRGLLMHEIGVHALSMGKTDAEFKSILKQADNMRKMGSKSMQAAYQRAKDAGTREADMIHEELAYFIEANPDVSLTKRVINWFRQMIRKLFPGFKYSESELVQMARDALKAAPESLVGEQGGMGDAEMQGQPMFSKRAAEQHAEKTLLTKLKESQPLDAAFRLTFELPRIPKLTTAAHDWVVRKIKHDEFSDTGYMAWANPIIEHLRAGLVDRHGLSDEYIRRDEHRESDKRTIQRKGVDFINRLIERNMDVNEAKVFKAMLEGEQIDDSQWNDIAPEVRQDLDAMGAELVDLGWISADTYDKHRGTWLHRVYEKHEKEQGTLQGWVSKGMARRRAKMYGNQFRQRGMNMGVTMDDLLRATPQDWFGRKRNPAKEDTYLKGEKFIVLDRVEAIGQGTETFEGMKSPGRKPKIRERVYWPAATPIPAKYGAWNNRGTWEATGFKQGKVTLWRDYSKAERESMGEILDARYVLGKTYMLLANDVANARFFDDVAKNQEWTWTGSEPPPADLTTTPQGAMSTYVGYEWVLVPETKLAGTGKYQWGPLAGKYIRAEIFRDLHELQRLRLPGVWKSLLTQWKVNKTAYSPVTHMNNVMSNFILMDLADVRMRDLTHAVQAMVTKSPEYRDAEAHGLFGSDMMSQEIRDRFMRPLLDTLQQEQADSMDMTVFSKAFQKAHAALSTATTVMRNIYTMEDEIFRMATYIRNLSQGMQPDDAARQARAQFLNYDIRAPWINAARETVLPFISYTYRAVPILAEAIAHRPWKLAKYVSIFYGLNALAYMLAPSDDDEDKERRSLPEAQSGNTWLGMPRMLRMPYLDENENPVFLDVRRWIPAGDVYDMNQGNSALPVPAPLQFGGPLMLAAELALNKSSFTGKEITNDLTDTGVEKAGRVGGYLWKTWMPNAPWIPGSWSTDKLFRAGRGGRDMQGRDYSLGQAAASAIGIKLVPQDVDIGFAYYGMEFERVGRALEFEMMKLSGDYQRDLISEEDYESESKDLQEKMRMLSERAKERFAGAEQE